MSFFRFSPEDIINTHILAYPSYNVELNGDIVTGSVYLEKKYLNDALFTRRFEGFSDKEGGLVQADGPFTSSIDIIDAELGATNKELYKSILNLYRFYNHINTNYTASFTGSTVTRYRVITIPEIYYDREILSGTFEALDVDRNNDFREIYDDGLGSIVTASYSYAGIDSHTIAFYRLEEASASQSPSNKMVKDWTTNEYHGYPYGHIEYNKEGIHSRAVYLRSGSTATTRGYIDLIDSAFDFGSTGGGGTRIVSGTIEFWFRPLTSSFWADGREKYITDLRSWDGTENRILFLKNSSNQLVFRCITNFTSSEVTITDTSGLKNAWHHYAMSFNSGSIFSAYLDGQLKGTGSFTRFSDWADMFTINAATSSAEGLWDEVRVSNNLVDIPTTWNTYINDTFLSESIVGNIFYSEGIVVLKGRGLNVESPSNDFGEVSSTNFKWRVSFKGTHKIPVKIFRCRANAGQLNASTNPTYHQFLTGTTAMYRNEMEIVMDPPATYVTAIGLYNDDYDLVGLAKLAQPIKKEESEDILFRLRLDF